jgi:hypothetical protein
MHGFSKLTRALSMSDIARQMCGRQRAVLCIGILVMVGMGLWPPWLIEIGKQETNEYLRDHRGHSYSPSQIVPGPHGFLFSPPSVDYWNPSDKYPNDPRRAAGVDVSRLVIQWVIVAALTAGAVVATKRSPRRPQQQQPSAETVTDDDLTIDLSDYEGYDDETLRIVKAVKHLQEQNKLFHEILKKMQ